ncbi:MAG: lipoate--protein ligase family protein [Candidatus Bathyarchaeota archaeon]|nr:lipoate--protein ligase family protein [Candidatus Bathyarchaeota archaeon]
MEQWRLIDLGKADPYMAQTFYEAVAEAVHRDISPNTLVLVQPDSPYACIGYHQDLEKEIDLDYIKKTGLPVIRRSQGGGATYLNSDQVFYQIIFKNSQALPTKVDSLFEKLLNVTVASYRILGVPAEFKPLNDVVVENRKISGNGAGVHETASILVGNFIMDLNYMQMARVLKVPDAKFRDKMASSMEQWVSSLRKELGSTPSPSSIKEVYVKEFSEQLGVEIIKESPTEAEYNIYRNETLPKHKSRDWLYMDSPLYKPGRAVKIAHEVKVVEVDHKAGKLLRLRAEVQGEEIIDLRITGDLFVVPKEAVVQLEQCLIGSMLDKKELTDKITKFYDENTVESPGVTVKDYVDAFMKLKTLT